MKARINIQDYADRVCIDICEHHRRIASMNKYDKSVEYTWLFEHICVNCPLEAMVQVLREERDQKMMVDIVVDEI